MNITMIEKKLKDLGYWILESGNGLHQLQRINNGEILEEQYNIEGLEYKIETLERND